MFPLPEEGGDRVADVCLRGRRPRRHRAGRTVLRGFARAFPEAIANALQRPSTRWIYNKYFVDEFYDATVVEPDGRRLAHAALARRRCPDDRRRGERGRQAAREAIGGVLKLAQSGYIRSYAAWVVAGSILLDRLHGPDGRPAMTLLDVVLFLPLIGFFAAAAGPEGQSASLARGRAGDFADRIRAVAGAARAVLVRQSHRLHVLDQRVLDHLSAHPLSRRARRPEPVAGAADHAADAHLRCWSPGNPSIIASRNFSRS